MPSGRAAKSRARAVLWPAMLLFTASIAHAAVPSYVSPSKFYVAPSPRGKDATDCSRATEPCATFQRAVDLCPIGQHCFIYAAPGTYSQKTNVTYYKAVTIWGSLSDEGKCNDRTAVVVDDRINGAAERGPIFWAQDHAVLWIVCMSVRGYAEGSVGFVTRQFSIGDVNEIKFGEFVGGEAVAATEESKINVLSPEIDGNATRFALAEELSQIAITGEIRISDNLRFDVAFLTSMDNSIVSVHPSAINGGKAFRGASYQCVNSAVKRDIILPGGDIPYDGNADCKISGLASDEPLSIADKVQEMQSKLDGNIRAVADKIQKMQGEFDNNIHALRAEARRNDVIAGVIVLLVVGTSTLAAWFRHRRQKRF